MDRSEATGGGVGASSAGGASGGGGAGGASGGGHHPWTQTSDLAGIFETAFSATSLERPLRSGQYALYMRVIAFDTCACV